MVVIVSIACTGCAATGATPRPFPTPDSAGENRAAAAAPRTSPSASGLPIRAGGYEISGAALALRGRPYRSGGGDPNGFDCSGLVRYVFAQHGIPLPRTVAEQFRAGGEATPDDLRPGDLVFFNTNNGGASHVGILVGGDSFVHAPTSPGVVRVNRLEETYWSTRFVGARRIVP